MLFKDILKRFVFPSLLLFSQVAISQGKVITGKVTDSKDGTPLRGVTILASGTETGTETQADGTYQISVSPSVTTLVFSSVGYIPQEVSIQGRSQINVTMDIANSVMSEVVVIGYGTAKKKDLTGSVASVSAKDFNKGAVTT
ncbi:MAG: carboxypeptidase-like regulatory domain-containing protein, partial [Bacteroidetes bacterium]|nr:carboxypeptidase-like regulatory domain-containing protein [Bacteroidota bacterium]